MITAALDRELATALRAVVARGDLPADAGRLNVAGTWRRAADGRPAAFATALPFELADLAGGTPASRAAQLAGSLSAPCLAADPAGGYLTLTVTWRALAQSAADMAAAGADCARSTILTDSTADLAPEPAAPGSRAFPLPWPDLAAAPTWDLAWQAQADAMTRHLAATAGQPAKPLHSRERAGTHTPLQPQPGGPVATIVAYRGADLVRYRLARTLPGTVGQTAAELESLLPGRRPSQPPPAASPLPGWPGPPRPDPLGSVRDEYGAATSTLRWAADVGLPLPAAAAALGDLLATAAERELLTRLALLPVRVAAAARRRRPDELPRYLESVSSAWRECRLTAPALPQGGRTAPRSDDLTSARLVLADAVGAVLAAGLALTGVGAGRNVSASRYA